MTKLDEVLMMETWVVELPRARAVVKRVHIWGVVSGVAYAEGGTEGSSRVDGEIRCRGRCKHETTEAWTRVTYNTVEYQVQSKKGLVQHQLYVWHRIFGNLHLEQYTQ